MAYEKVKPTYIPTYLPTTYLPLTPSSAEV